MSTCQFSSQYFDYDKGEEALFEYRERIGSGEQYCFFHNELNFNNLQLVKSKEIEISHKLKEYIRKSVTDQEPLFFIGYHFPVDIVISQKFSRPVYFNSEQFIRRLTLPIGFRELL
jgi:hypothetical protein